MIRLSEIKLTLAQAEQPQAALRAAVAGVLGVDEAALGALVVFKRSFDARKAELMAVYIVDVALADPALAAKLNAFRKQQREKVAQADAELQATLGG